MTPGEIERRAAEFAATAHAGQTRKYTGEPYIVHPRAVADIVRTVAHDEAMIAAALLHDVVEDCGVGLIEIQDAFGPDVAELVAWLTDVSIPSDGNRAARKAVDREHIAKAPARAQTIKLADLIDNTKTIVARDPNFAKVYCREKEALLDVLTLADPALIAIAKAQLEEYTGIIH
jgi:(p)ppGpp synthase/HD superfamily hydrolase